MIREFPYRKTRDGKRHTKLICLEADFSDIDTTNIAGGSELYVINTANNPKLYDEENDKWYDSTGTEYTGS